MDAYEVARRAKALPARFADRLGPGAYRDVELNIGVGEWGEGLDNLLAAFQNTGTPISAAERAELAELLAAIGMGTERLDAVPE